MNNKEKKGKSPVSRLTIVGGQPGPKSPPVFNTNIEKVLLKASGDKNFKESLFNDRKSALENPEISLSPQDKMILEAIPYDGLKTMIEKFSHQKTSRRNFLKGAAASAALIVTGSLLAPALAQTPIAPTGIAPDQPTPAPTLPLMLIDRIGPEGKTMIYENTGLKLVIPAEALEKTEEIKIEVIKGASLDEKDSIPHLEIYQFSPSDIKLQKEAIIYFPVSDLNGKVISGYRLDESGWHEVPVEIEEDYALIKTKEFGTYTIGEALSCESPYYEEYPSPTRGIDTSQ